MNFKKLTALCMIALLVSGDAIAQCPGGVCPTRPGIFRRAAPRVVDNNYRAPVQQVSYQPAYPQPAPVQISYPQPSPVQVSYQPAPVQVVYTQPAPEPPPKLVLVKQSVVDSCPCLKLGACPCANPQVSVPPAPIPTYAPAPVRAAPMSYGSAGSAVSYGSSGSVATYSPGATYGTYLSGSGTSVQVSYPTRSRYVRTTAGPTWTYNGSDLANHLRSVHGKDPTGMSYQEMVDAHSDAHNQGGGFGSRGFNLGGRIRLFRR